MVACSALALLGIDRGRRIESALAFGDAIFVNVGTNIGVAVDTGLLLQLLTCHAAALGDLVHDLAALRARGERQSAECKKNHQLANGTEHVPFACACATLLWHRRTCGAAW